MFYLYAQKVNFQLSYQYTLIPVLHLKANTCFSRLLDFFLNYYNRVKYIFDIAVRGMTLEHCLYLYEEINQKVFFNVITIQCVTFKLATLSY